MVACVSAGSMREGEVFQEIRVGILLLRVEYGRGDAVEVGGLGEAQEPKE